MGENAQSTGGTARVLSRDTWECVNCGEFYEGGDEEPGTCAWCNEHGGWKRLWKVKCEDCGQVYHAVDKSDALGKVATCDHDPSWTVDDNADTGTEHE